MKENLIGYLKSESKRESFKGIKVESKHFNDFSFFYWDNFHPKDKKLKNVFELIRDMLGRKGFLQVFLKMSYTQFDEMVDDWIELIK